MRVVLSVLALCALLAAVGCEQIGTVADKVSKEMGASKQPPVPAPPAPEPAAKPTAKTAPEPAAKPAPKTTGKPEFEGHYLKVWVDGKQTQPAGSKSMGENVWTVDACSANPEIKFEMDTAHLGELKATDIVINPIKDGKPVHTDIWHADGARAMKAGQALKLAGFNHFVGGGLVRAAKLPPGRYSIKVSANGQKTWDRQTIEATVK